MTKYIIKYLIRDEQDDTEYTFDELKNQFKIEDEEYNKRIDKCEDTFDLLQVVNEYDREYDFKEVFYSNLKKIRNDRGMTKVSLADKSNVSVNIIAKYETGERDIDKASIENLSKLASTLGVKISDILENNKLIKNVEKCM